MDNLGIYLGMSMLHEGVGFGSFHFLIAKVRQKLLGWDTMKLLIAERITLVRSVLLSIPNYFMTTARVPIIVCMKIEKLARSFI